MAGWARCGFGLHEGERELYIAEGGGGGGVNAHCSTKESNSRVSKVIACRDTVLGPSPIIVLAEMEASTFS